MIFSVDKGIKFIKCFRKKNLNFGTYSHSNIRCGKSTVNSWDNAETKNIYHQKQSQQFISQKQIHLNFLHLDVIKMLVIMLKKLAKEMQEQQANCVNFSMKLAKKFLWVKEVKKIT